MGSMDLYAMKVSLRISMTCKGHGNTVTFQLVLKACGGQSAGCHVTVATEEHVHPWTEHVTVTLDGRVSIARMVRGTTITKRY